MEMNDFINGCIAMEKAAELVYSSFMQLFPQEKDFWGDLVRDEIGHASFLIDADNLGLFDKLKITYAPLSMPLLYKTLKFAENINNKIRFNPVSLEDAFKMALKLEESILETFTNNLIGALLTDPKSSFDKLLTETRLHADKIRDMMIKKGFLKLS
jgi:rubrerythrin